MNCFAHRVFDCTNAITSANCSGERFSSSPSGTSRARGVAHPPRDVAALQGLLCAPRHLQRVTPSPIPPPPPPSASAGPRSVSTSNAWILPPAPSRWAAQDCLHHAGGGGGDLSVSALRSGPSACPALPNWWHCPTLLKDRHATRRIARRGDRLRVLRHQLRAPAACRRPQRTPPPAPALRDRVPRRGIASAPHSTPPQTPVAPPAHPAVTHTTGRPIRTSSAAFRVSRPIDANCATKKAPSPHRYGQTGPSP